jgi:uncharacterized protein YjbI with pentapeptide repeats
LAKLDGADFSDADLEGAEGVTQLSLIESISTPEQDYPEASGGEMTNADHDDILRRGIAAWSAWRSEQNEIPDLSGAGLRGLDLSGFDLSHADLRGADLRGTNFSQANLSAAHLEGANLFKAVLDGADLAGAHLSDAQFLNCAQLIVTRNWQSAFRDDALACGASLPDIVPSE